jgi:hypothetical protein
MYWIEPPLGFVEAFHWRPIEQPEYDEQLASGSATSTGAVGGDGSEIVKEQYVDQGDTRDVFFESRAWTRQYQVPVGRLGDQVIVLIHPDE